MVLLTYGTIAAFVLCSFARHIPVNSHRYELSKRMPGHLSKRAPHTNAHLTYYNTEGGTGACGRPLSDSQWIVALNAPEFGDGYPGPNCFKMVTIEYNGKQVQAQIEDKCPGCPPGGLDLTPTVFWALTNVDKPIETATWWYTDDAPVPVTSEKPKTTEQPKPPTTSQPPPPPSTTKTPEQTTTSTTPSPSPSPSTSSTTEVPSTSSSSTVLSTSIVATSISNDVPSTTPSAASTSAPASATAVANAGHNGVLDDLYQAIIGIGSLTAAGGQAV